MKKMICLFLSFVLCFAFAACDDPKEEAASKETAAQGTTAETESKEFGSGTAAETEDREPGSGTTAEPDGDDGWTNIY